MSEIIRVEDVWFRYEGADFWALKGVSLTIKKGELLAIIGQNGGGKTTLAKNLNGLLKPTKGRVLVDGLDTKTASTHEIVKRVGYVFQNPSHQIFESTVWKEVAYGPTNLGLSPEEVKQSVEWALSEVGLQGYEQYNPYDLDYGKMKLLTVASVLAMKPQVLILDEPTTGQDHAGRHLLSNLSKKLNREGFTVVIITHDMRFVAETVNRVVLVSNGEILMDGSTREVLNAFDVLKKAAIKPPQIVQLASELRKKGVDINALTVEEALQEILKHYKG
ncbi:cobalt/nickel ABC transporter ATP-binding protein [Thermofilum adornatum 1505]|uniref:Cobalt/nickel ABC transporter ATP-binding protein n=1 Tax=Thermofilum adornatum 1505 TaxID=697581 RepID=A0A3G1A710_9CREN|nr:ABC transporter ATP-binding protein [Thermofilum adornatum]AJB41958.1 cobalt/nickel ABC transporter ATP-binding protein [Thermofilum adornatum 1505]